MCALLFYLAELASFVPVSRVGRLKALLRPWHVPFVVTVL